MSENMRTVALDENDWDEEPPPYSATTEKDPEAERKTGFNKAYLFSVEGALKLIEIVLSLIGFVAVLAGGWTGSGFVGWTTISAFITTTIMFIIVAMNIYSRLPGFWPLYELIYLILYTLKYFICSIIAAVGAARLPSIVAACVICVVAFGIYLLDTIMAYKRFKVAKEEQERRRNEGEGGANRRSETHFCIIF
ncbi:uncharacterized protein LOC132751400 [Ruditapes philippinarum]|uniref:uncharacterized protein LOC132751400 n=1 Tax=Ruditapes philippinarum TaxID=129788 RepID=UPI00295C27F0|nr:uncharacterized protein LOC132751400 [Ruditapes philippinarum]